LPATALAEQANPASGIEASEVANPLGGDKEYRGWISAANAAEESKDWHKLEKFVLKIIAREQEILGRVNSEIAESYSWLASTLGQLGRHEEALAMHQQVLEIRRKVLGSAHPDTLTSTNSIALTLIKLGRNEEALAMYQQVLELSRKVQGGKHPNTLSAMNNLAFTLSGLGRYEEALTMQKQVLELSRKVQGDEHPATLTSMNNLAQNLSGLGRYEEALAMHQQVLELFRKVRGDEHPDTLTSMNNFALSLYEMGRYEEALTMQKQVLELSRKVQGDEHPATLLSMSNLAQSLSQLGRNEEAHAMHQQVLELRRKVQGDEHPDTLIPMNNLAQNLSGLGRYEEAVAMQKQVLEIYRKILGHEHPDTLISMDNLAQNLSGVGRYEEALTIGQQVLELKRKVRGDEHPATLTSMNSIARTLMELGRYKEALTIGQQVLELRRKVRGDEHPDTLGSMDNLALILSELGRYEEALAMHQQVLDLFRKVLGDEHPDTLGSMNNLARNLSELRRYEEALTMDQQVLELKRKVQGNEHPATLTSMNNLGQNLINLGRHEEALEMHREVLELLRKVLGDEHPNTLTSMNNVAFTLAQLGRYEEALTMDQQVLEFKRRVLGDEHPNTIGSMNNLAQNLSELGRYEEALAIHQQVLELFRKVLGDEHPDALVSMSNLALIQLGLAGHAHEALGYVRKAHKGHLRRMKALGGLGVRGEEQLTRDRVDVEGSSSLLADALWAAARGKAPSSRTASEAFEALQISTAGTSSDAVARSAALRHAAASGVGDEARRRRELAGEWIAIEKQSMEALSSGTNRDTERRKILAGRLNEISSAIRSIDTVLERRAPRYFSIMRQTPLRISETRKLLREDEAVLIISPTSFGTHVIALTGKGTVWKRAAPDAAKITALVNRLRGDLDPAGSATARGPDLSLPGAGSMPSFDRQSAFELYTALIEPVADMLRGSSQVYIVADGALASLPFGVLVTSRPREGEDSSDPDVLRNTAWLADAWPIVQLPSLQSLAYLRTYNRPAIGALASSGFAGFGDPLLGGKPFERGSRTASLPAASVNSLTGTGVTDNGALLMDPERLRRLARLPGTARELEGVRLSLKAPASSLRLAEQMTEGSIRSSNLTDIGILHLATHGLTAAQSGTLAEPGLVFTPPAKATPADDGYLSSSEVIGLDLTNTDWVILSACNTAAASGKDGEAGLSGLARSFFYAGASTLLVSHWPVDDDVAARITTSTINYSAKGMSRAHALKTAMHDVRLSPNPRLAHPSAWAPFSILGDGR
jgi:tetratricopeptide (TPR) repeat protein/CHAT domain-containing protein